MSCYGPRKKEEDEKKDPVVSDDIKTPPLLRRPTHALLSEVMSHAELDQGVVTTIAGTGASGFSDDSKALKAQFAFPVGLATTTKGDALYICDADNKAVRKMESDGSVSTVGKSFLGGNNEAFRRPYGVTVDSYNYVYVTDTEANTVKRISPSGAIAQIDIKQPQLINGAEGICVDEEGNIFLANTLSHNILMIAPDGHVEVIAGSGITEPFADGEGTKATFHHPCSICIDVNKTLYVADMKNQRIRRINKMKRQDTTTGKTVTAWLVSTCAGSGEAGFYDGPVALASFCFPSGVCVNERGTVYVADTSNHLVRRIRNGYVTTVCGVPSAYGFSDGVGSRASLYFPVGICLDPNGDLFVSQVGADAYRLRHVRLYAHDGEDTKASDIDPEMRTVATAVITANSKIEKKKDEDDDRVCTASVPSWLRWF